MFIITFFLKHKTMATDVKFALNFAMNIRYAIDPDIIMASYPVLWNYHLEMKY